MKAALKTLAVLAATAGLAASDVAARPTTPQARYLYYLHGKLIEDQGPRGVSPRFGPYDYAGILDAFRRRGFTVLSEVRPKDTDVAAYADRVVADLRRRIAAGTPPAAITVVGASKGSVIASLVSTRLGEAHVRYVLLANCNDWLIRAWNPRWTGEILSIWEASDDIGGSCAAEAARSPALTRFAEVRLTTGLGHGIVYRPLPAWLNPAIAWARR